MLFCTSGLPPWGCLVNVVGGKSETTSYYIYTSTKLYINVSHIAANARKHAYLYRGRNKPKLPLVCRISDMLKTTCPPTYPLVQVLVHFVGPKEIILVLQPFLIYHNENIIIY